MIVKYILTPLQLCVLPFLMQLYTSRRCHSLIAVRTVNPVRERGSLTVCPHAALNALSAQMENTVIKEVQRRQTFTIPYPLISHLVSVALN